MSAASVLHFFIACMQHGAEWSYSEIGIRYVMKRSVGIKPKTKADIAAEEESALQKAKEVINEIYGEMEAHHTIDEAIRPTNRPA